MKNIALAMSGEGYRAVAFSFGALSYPNNVRYGDHYLLKNVTFVSSTSGSSITPIACSAALCRGHAFSMIYYLLLHAIDAEKGFSPLMTAAEKQLLKVINKPSATTINPQVYELTQLPAAFLP